jgi:hypothetical protein
MPACRRVRKACLGTSSEDDALEPYPSIDWESRHACVVAVSNGVGTTGIEGMRGTSHAPLGSQHVSQLLEKLVRALHVATPEAVMLT